MTEHVLAQTLQDAYGLAPPVDVSLFDTQGANNTAYGVRTSANRFVLKRYDTHYGPEALRYEQQLMVWLATQPLPFAVPAPLPTRSGDTLLAFDGGWHVLMPWLPGHQPNRESVTEHELVGAGLALLHNALERCPLGERPGVWPYGDLERVHPAIPDPYNLTPAQLGLEQDVRSEALLAWWRELAASFRPFIEREYAGLPWQIIHGDFDPLNTLVEDGRLSAILDFEVTGRDARALDLAAGLNFTLRFWENADRWHLAEALLRGYGRYQHLGDEEIVALPRLILLREIASRVWWFGRNAGKAEVARHVGWLADLRDRVTWLDVNGERLIAFAARETQS